MIVNTEKDPDLGLRKFSFKFRDKVYTVLPKNEEGFNRIDEYLKYIAGVCKKPDLNPFMYKAKGKSPKELFDIRPAGTGDDKKEEYDFSQIIKELKEKGKQTPRKNPIKNPLPVKDLMKHKGPKVEQMSLFASDMGRVRRVLLKYAGWEDKDATLFWDEVTNQEIKKDDAKKILDAFEKGADTEHSVSDVTGIDSYTCKKVLDIANKNKLLK
jgi:hypothetical protein